MAKRKTISLPGLHDLDIQDILPLVNLPQVQRLRGLKQLGPSFVFIGSNHTRFDHSLYTYAIAKERVQRWRQDESITQEEGRTLELYALLHDIGHSAYSHAIENLCEKDHNEHGLELLHTMESEIKLCGGNIQLLLGLMSHRNPLHACVSDRPLGADKLAYLLLDARNTTEQLGIGTGALLNHVSYTGTGLAIDTTIVPQTLALWQAYVSMYTQVYCRKASLIFQRFLEQIVDYAIRAGSVQQNELQELDDSGLDAVLASSKDAQVCAMFKNFKERKMPKSAIEIRPAEVDPLLRSNGKPVYVHSMPLNDFARLPQLEQSAHARTWEWKIANILGIPDDQVLIVPPVPMSRFLPNDVPIIDDGNTAKGMLQSKRPQHYAALIESITAATALRVCVFEQHRALAATPKHAATIIAHLLRSS